jgi:hypothetical protein
MENKMHELLISMGVKPNLQCPSWVPFVYVDMLSEEIATRANQVAFDHGFPVRHCLSFGKPTFLLLGVRLLAYSVELVNALKNDEQIQQMLLDLKN